MTHSDVAASTQPQLNKTNSLLLLLLLVQILIVAWVYWPQGVESTAGAPLLGALAPQSVTRLTVTDDSENVTTLERTDEGWVLAGSDGFPVREGIVEPLLEKLAAVTAERRVTETASSHGRLQVADDAFLRKIEIAAADGIKTLLIGSSAGSGATHVRVAGEESTYLTRELTAFDFSASATTWIDALYVSIPQDQIDALTLINADGTLELSRAAPAEDGTPGEWTLSGLSEGETADSAAISTLLSRVSNVRLVAPVGTSLDAAYGLAAPSATVEISHTDGEGAPRSLTLAIGAADAEGENYYAKSTESDYVVTVGAFMAEDLISTSRADLVAVPEAEEGSE